MFGRGKLEREVSGRVLCGLEVGSMETECLEGRRVCWFCGTERLNTPAELVWRFVKRDGRIVGKR